MATIFEETLPDKEVCPHCGRSNCFVEVAEDDVTSYLCMDCGFTTTSLNIEGSMQMIDWEQTLPELVKAIKWVDPATKLIWLSSTLNVPGKGIVFPDGSSPENWKWRSAPVVDVLPGEQKKYPVAGKPGEFYKTKVDFEQSLLFDQMDFQNACKHIGLIQAS